MAMARHAAADDRAVEHVEGGEQRGGAVALVVVGHGAGLARLQRQARLGAVERLDLALLIERQHQAVRRRLEVQPDDRLELGGEVGIARTLEGADAVRLQIVPGPDPLYRAQGDRDHLRHGPAGPMGTSPGGSVQVSATTRRTMAASSRGLPGLRVASHKRLSTPARANRRCQRHTAGRPTPTRLATSATFSRSAECRMIRARATCFWARFRSATIASKRARSSAETNGQTI